MNSRFPMLAVSGLALAFGLCLDASASPSTTVDALVSASIVAAAAAPSERTTLFKERTRVTYESLTSVERVRVDTTLDYADRSSQVNDWDCSIHAGGVYCENDLGSCWCDWDISPPSCGCSDNLYE